MREFLSDGFAIFLFGAALGISTTYWIGVSGSDRSWRKETIERGLGQYCPNNGEWAWKGECDE